MLSVLYVDDESGLLEIGKIYLENTGDFTVETITSARKALSLLDTGDYHAIVSDYQMPEMDGIAFLKAVRARSADIPFILFTGRGREEIVIQAINEGADFYLQKGGDPAAQFAELAHKIRQAAGRRNAEQALKDSEKRLEDIIDFLPDATFAIDRAGHVIAWNRAIEEMTGVPASEMLGKGDYEYAVPFYGRRRKILIDRVFEPDEVIAEHYANITREKGILTADTNLPRPKGRVVTLMGKASPLYNRQGVIVGAIESIRDITDLKTTEKVLRAQYDTLAASEQQIRENELRLTYMLGFYGMAKQPEQDLLSYAVEGAGAVTGSPLGYLAFLNDDESVLTMYAWSKAAMGECAMRDKPITYPVEKTGLWGEAVRQRRPVITNNYSAPDPKKKGYPKGHPHIIRHMNVPITDSGHIVIVAGVANKSSDYTESEVRELTLLMQGLWQVLKMRRTEDELRAANEQLTASEEELRGQYDELAAGEQRIRESEARFRDLAGLLPQIVFEMDMNLRVTYANQSANTMLGLTREDIEQGTDALSFIDPAQRERARHALDSILRGRSVGEYEYTMVRKDGTRFPALIYPAPVHHAGALAGFRGVIVDISSRKKAEEALRESEKKFRDLFNNLTDAVYIHEILPDETPGRIVEVNDVMCSRLGYSREELLSMNLMDIVSEEHRKKVPGIRAQMSGSGFFTFNAEHKSRNGSVIPVEVNSHILTLSGRRVALAVARDISERKKVEETLRESEARYRTVFETAEEGIWIIDTDFRTVSANRKMQELFGYTEQEMLGRPVWDFVPPEDAESMKQELAKRPRGIPGRYERQWVRRDGTIIWCLTAGTPLFAPDGKFTGSFGMFTDMTGRRAMEAALRESEAKYRTVVEQSTDAIFIAQDGVLVFHNAALAAMTGFAGAELEGRPIADLVAPEDRNLVTTRHGDRLSGKPVPDTYEFSVLHRDGIRRIRVIMHVSALTFAGRPATLGTLHDITEARQKEEALRESEEKYRSIIENIQDFVYRTDRDGNLTMASPSLAKLFGYDTIEECIGTNIAKRHWMYPERRKDFLEAMQEKGSLTGYEILLKKKDGTPITVSASSHFYRDRDGNIAGVEGIFHDITAVRAAEQQVRLLAGLNDISPASVIVHTPEGEMVYANQRTFDMHGWTRDEFMTKNLDEITVPERGQRISGRVDTLRRCTEASFDVRHFRKDGSVIDLSVNARIMPWNGREVILSVSTDITDRKRAENALRESEERYHRITDNARDMIYRMTLPDGRYEYVSPASAALTGYSPEEFYADPALIKRLIHPAWHDFFRQHWEALLQGKVPPLYEYQIIDRQGRTRWINQRNTLIRDSDGRPAAIEGIATDITKRRQTEDALRMANRKLNLLSGITRHDILNKIAVVLGFLKITRQKCSDPALAGYLAKMESEVTAIRTQAEFTRVYQDLGTSEPQWIGLDAVLPRGHVPQGVTFASDVHGVSVFGDLMLEKVFYNLLDNSVRHGGHVTEIRVHARNTGKDLLISWEDNGNGIAADDKEQIFERGFGRNNGFGLFLSREILAITGITIRENGEPGRGARFEITVPEGGWKRSGERTAGTEEP